MGTHFGFISLYIFFSLKKMWKLTKNSSRFFKPQFRNGFVSYNKHFNQRFYSAAATNTSEKAVTYEVKDNIAVVKIDIPGAKVNTLSSKFMEDFVPVLDEIQANRQVDAAVIISGKADNFIAGADIDQLASCETEEELLTLVKSGHNVMSKMTGGKP